MKVKTLKFNIELHHLPGISNIYRASIMKKNGQQFVGYGGYITEALHNCIESIEMNCDNEDIIFSLFGEFYPGEKRPGELIKI